LWVFKLCIMNKYAKYVNNENHLSGIRITTVSFTMDIIQKYQSIVIWT
jgi:nucleoside-specific outer membrane channel protein Tsx